MIKQTYTYKVVLLTIFCMLIGTAPSLAIDKKQGNPGSSYYVDSRNGNDNNDGKSKVAAWASLQKVNSIVFKPGDSILFKSDGMWTGTLKPKGSGSPGKPVVVSSYGSDKSKPILNGNGALQVVHLQNLQYWELTNLEIMNTANPKQKKRGIEVENIDQGTLTHIVIRDNYVHDILGDNSAGTYGSFGICILAHKGPKNIPSNFDSVRIERNIVKTVNRTGIGVNSSWRCRASILCKENTPYLAHTNVIIRNNYVENAGGDGIVSSVTKGALIEYNMLNGANINSGGYNAGIWSWDGDQNVFQFNEAYNVKTTKDGEGYDVDFGQDGTIFQYNYSHDNEGGFIVVCAPAPNLNTNAIIRYNISQNDRERIVHLTGASRNVKVYNNTFFLPEGSTTQPISVGNWNGRTESAYFYNNIYYLKSAGRWKDWYTIPTRVFENNIIYGVHTAEEPTGINNLNVDPGLVAPGGGTSGSLLNGVINFGNVDAYKLQANSPALSSGKIINQNGGSDYWGNPVSPDKAPNIGAYNGQGIELKNKSQSKK